MQKNLFSARFNFGLVEKLAYCHEQSEDETADENVEDSSNIRQLQRTRRLMLRQQTTTCLLWIPYQNTQARQSSYTPCPIN